MSGEEFITNEILEEQSIDELTGNSLLEPLVGDELSTSESDFASLANTSSETTLSIEEDLTGFPGGTVKVPIFINDAAEVQSLTLSLNYDTDVFDVIDPNADTETNEAITRTGISADWMLTAGEGDDPDAELANPVASVDDEAGEITISLFNPDGVTPAGSGNILEIDFTIADDAEPDSTTIIDLRSVRLGIDGETDETVIGDSLLGDGSITVGDPGDPGDPTDPTDPGDPGDPTDPTDPGDPTDPTDPGDPGDPGDPLELTGGTAQIAYVAYYGRPADSSGLDFWNGVLTDNEVSYAPREGDFLTGQEQEFYNQIVNDFGNSEEANRLFGEFDSNREQVNQVYQFAFNRDGDAGGLDFWTNQIEQGNVTLSTFALEVALGAQNEDIITLNNKIESADMFTDGVNTQGIADYSGSYGENFGRNWLSGYGDTVSSQSELDSAFTDLVSGSPF